MCFFRRKKLTDNEKVVKDNDILRTNTAKAKVLKSACKIDTIVQRLNKIIDDLQYSSPSKKETIQKIDNKISNKLDDLKILILGGKSEEKILSEVEELEILVAERISFLEAGI